MRPCFNKNCPIKKEDLQAERKQACSPCCYNGMTNSTHPILLFDGVCNLCNQSVQFIINRDKRELFQFAALQSEAGKALLQKHQLPTEQMDTVVLVMGNKAYTRSDAALQVLRQLGMPWSLATVFFILPKGFRDLVYNYIATNRYRWFGHQESCMMPTADLKRRFLD